MSFSIILQSFSIHYLLVITQSGGLVSCIHHCFCYMVLVHMTGTHSHVSWAGVQSDTWNNRVQLYPLGSRRSRCRIHSYHIYLAMVQVHRYNVCSCSCHWTSNHPHTYTLKNKDGKSININTISFYGNLQIYHFSMLQSLRGYKI